MMENQPTYSEEKSYFLPYGTEANILYKTYYELVLNKK